MPNHEPNYKKQPRVDSYALLNNLIIEGALIASFALPIVKAPVRFARDMVFVNYAKAMRYIIEKSALGVSHVLSSIVNNKLTRRITPSVSSLDERIESACTGSGKFLGRQFVRVTSWAYYLSAVAFATSITLLVASVSLVCFSIYMAYTLTLGCIAACDDVNTKTKEAAAEHTAMFDKIRTGLRTAIHHSAIWATGLFVVSLLFLVEKAATLVSAPFAALAYTLSSLLGLDNRFNIYNYKSDIGVVHGRILDVYEGNAAKYMLYFPDTACERLQHEATSVSSNCEWNDIPETNLSSPVINVPISQREAFYSL